MYRICFLLAIIAQNLIGGWSRDLTQNSPIQCALDVDKSLVKINQPVMVSFDGKDYSLASPEKYERKSVIKVPSNSQILLVCPGKDNEISAAHESTVTTACNRNNQLQIERGKRIIAGTNKFYCKKPITPEIRKTDKKCGENSSSTIYNIGYTADLINEWFKLLSVCHDAANMNTLYSISTIEGASIKARQKNVPRPPEFMEGSLPELYEGTSPNKYYLKKSQVENFQKLFAPESIKDFFNMYYKFLSRGHLTPDADMAMSNWKVATYMYINVAPQWQMINARNWLRVENAVRDAAIWSQDDFKIATGTYGVLKLRIGKKEHELYLAPNKKLKVPEQFWKIIYHKPSQTAIVIITSNNPYNTVQPICRDVCRAYGWWDEYFQQEKNLSRGLTYCCTYKEFKEIVTYAPVLEVQGTYIKPLEPPPTGPLPRFRAAVNKVVKNAPWKRKQD